MDNEITKRYIDTLNLYRYQIFLCGVVFYRYIDMKWYPYTSFCFKHKQISSSVE
jgi:hypothetical protein